MQEKLPLFIFLAFQIRNQLQLRVSYFPNIFFHITFTDVHHMILSCHPEDALSSSWRTSAACTLTAAIAKTQVSSDRVNDVNLSQVLLVVKMLVNALSGENPRIRLYFWASLAQILWMKSVDHKATGQGKSFYDKCRASDWEWSCEATTEELDDESSDSPAPKLI